MTTFRPPINSRSTEELIEIKHSSTDAWQQEAINQAKKELTTRGVPDEEEQAHLTKLRLQADRAEKAEQRRLKRNAVESYTKPEMLEIFLTAPFILTGNWRAGLSLWSLKEENFRIKFRQRLWLLIGGLIAWCLAIRFSV